MFVLILSAWAGELEDVRAAAQRYPQDYSSQLRLAQVATDPKEALEAWKQAWTLSGGNLEVYPGLVQAALAVGDVALAREVAAEAVEKAPESAVVWRLQALALATPKGVEASEWATLHSQAAVRAALSREPEGMWSDCLRAWNRLRLGDLPGVRQVGAEGDCAPSLSEKAPLSAGLFLSGTVVPTQSLGGSGTLWAGTSLKQGLSLELLGRYSAYQAASAGGSGGDGAAYGRV
ncbi:MAG TPA: tetratricopeptide repeat protein, partial [Myxococcota bacterium]|nr:tetratricopeptide repeat protein [Myxococcota bacterium]